MATRDVRISAGKLRDVIEFQARIDVDNGDGTSTPTWKAIPHGRCRADVQPVVRRMSGAEAIHAQQLMGGSTFHVETYFREDVTARHRVILIGPPDVPANIISDPADPDGRRRVLQFVCNTVLTEG